MRAEGTNAGRRGAKRFLGAGGRLPLLCFVAAVALLAFCAGGLTVKYRLPPYDTAAAAVTTLKTARDAIGAADRGLFARFADVPRERAAARRLQLVDGDPPGYRLLWWGGRFQFLDYCPQWGCLAVEYDAAGNVAHTYPLRPAELERAWTEALASANKNVERAIGFAFQKHARVDWMRRYANGDLLVAITTRFLFPYPLGVVRVDRAGRPLWFHVAGSNHHVGEIGDDGIAVWPGYAVADGPLSLQVADANVDLMCARPFIDTIDFISARGHRARRIDLLAALRASAHVSILPYSTTARTLTRTPCDITHLNAVGRLSASAGGAWGLAPGDLVVSMRHLSAFAILDPASAKVKRVVRGSFAHQHTVLHVDGAKFLMFDNNGRGDEHGPSRALLVDLADGRETTLFPNARTPRHLSALYANEMGHVSISPDRKRAIVAFNDEGVAAHIRIADGELVGVFRSLHDVSGLDQFAGERQARAATFNLRGLDFIAREN